MRHLRPRLDQEIAGLQAQAQVNQLNQKIQAQDWTRDINYRDQATGLVTVPPRWRVTNQVLVIGHRQAIQVCDGSPAEPLCGYAEPAWAGRSASPRARLPETAERDRERGG